MFSFLFGRQEKPVNDSPLATLKILTDKESDLDKRIDMLSKQISRFTSEAVQAHKAGEKSKALLIMKKKSLCEEQIKTNSAMMMKIIEQKAALESSYFNKNTLDVLSQATRAIKTTQASIDAETAKAIIDEMEDAKSAHNEIVDLLREPFSNSNDDLLTDELEALVSASSPSEPQEPEASPLPLLPAVPTTEIKVSNHESEMEKELSALALRLPA